MSRTRSAGDQSLLTDCSQNVCWLKRSPTSAGAGASSSQILVATITPPTFTVAGAIASNEEKLLAELTASGARRRDSSRDNGNFACPDMPRKPMEEIASKKTVRASRRYALLDSLDPTGFSQATAVNRPPRASQRMAGEHFAQQQHRLRLASPASVVLRQIRF